VTVDFDICYDTEDDSLYPTIAYDGVFLRISDVTEAAGRTKRSVFTDAFAETLTTGNLIGYPKHLNDDRNANYFGDTSAWAGSSNGMQHVTIRLPGMAAATPSCGLNTRRTNMASARMFVQQHFVRRAHRQHRRAVG